VNIFDLTAIAQILTHPCDFLHYLDRRSELERSRYFIGEEMDLLALYLSTCFNTGSAEFEAGRAFIVGESDAIDKYFYGREGGMELSRPQVNRTDWWEAILTKLESKRADRWTLAGLSLCNVAPDDQIEFEKNLKRLRTNILIGSVSPETYMTLVNGPIQRRHYLVGTVVPQQSAEERNAQYNALISGAFNSTDADSIVFVGIATEPSDSPYSVIGYAERAAVANQKAGKQR